MSTLLAEHGGRLFALLYRLTLRHDAAEDLLQEMFCKLAQSDGFRRADNGLAYAYRAATNLALDWRRANKRNPIIGSNCESSESSISAPLADLVRREQLEQTLNAISQLPKSGREIVVLRYLEQRSYEAIAEQLGKTTQRIIQNPDSSGLRSATPPPIVRVPAGMRNGVDKDLVVEHFVDHKIREPSELQPTKWQLFRLRFQRRKAAGMHLDLLERFPNRTKEPAIQIFGTAAIPLGG
jgi:RNA polymerase sigma-70 factor (ECF subfamily)